MNLEFLKKLKNDLNAEYSDLIEMKNESYIGSIYLEIEAEIQRQINSKFENLFETLERANSELEDLTDFVEENSIKELKEPTLAAVFMKISDLKSNSLHMRNVFENLKS